MKPVVGTLKGTSVYISKSKDVGRLYGKSRFGHTIPKNILQLNLIEAIYLVNENKLRVKKQDGFLDFKDLVDIAAFQYPSFETSFLIFQDLRNRGQQVTFPDESDYSTLLLKKKDDISQQNVIISAFSERNPIHVSELKNLAEQALQTQADCWISIVDEEGDITYYELVLSAPDGSLEPYGYPLIKGLFLDNRAIIFDAETVSLLHEKEFFGKPFCSVLQLSPIEAAYLMKESRCILTTTSGETIDSFISFQKILENRQSDYKNIFSIYEDLKKRKTIVKTGFKFGAHFRVYTNDPMKTHAEYVIQAVDIHHRTIWSEISRAVRLAHSVNKIFIYALVSEDTPIAYLQFRRLRP